MKNKIQIGIVDDHILLRDAIVMQIDSLPDCEVILKAHHGMAMIEEIQKGKIPDLMIVDISMDVMDGFATTDWLFKNHPAMHVMILSMYETEYNIIKLLQMGVKAFLRKDAETTELQHAIDSVIKYGSYLPLTITRNLTSLFHHPHNASFTHPLLMSENEIKFLTLVCSELTYTEIAKEMFVSPRTVENYRNKLTERLNLKSRTGLAVYALKNGIVRL